MELKVGQKVRVKRYKLGEIPGHIVHGMEPFMGKIVTISNIVLNQLYLRETGSYYWHNDNFEPVNSTGWDL